MNRTKETGRFFLQVRPSTLAQPSCLILISLISSPFPANLRQGFKGKEFDLNAGDEEKLDMVIPSKQVRHLSHSLKSAPFLTVLELLRFRVGTALSLCKPARPTNISLRFVVTTSQFLPASIQLTYLYSFCRTLAI